MERSDREVAAMVVLGQEPERRWGSPAVGAGEPDA
jgi:hypothetical protein